MNAGKTKFKLIVFNRRSSAFIGGQSGFRVFLLVYYTENQ